MTTMTQNSALLKELFKLLAAQRPVVKQGRTFQRIIGLVLAEMFTFSRHTVTQLLMSLGLTEQDWSTTYRLFSQGRFDYARASEILLEESLTHVAEDSVYVVAGDGTQTPRSSGKIEGSGWLRNLRSPHFKVGIHRAQRWFNGSWLMPPEQGYSRAMPLRWMPAFTRKSKPVVYAPSKEWEAAVSFLSWLREQFTRQGRAAQRLLMVADGSYDHLELWKQLPDQVILLARSAKNRALYSLPGPDAHRNRKYGERAPTPQSFWQQRSGWTRITLVLRGRERTLQYKVKGLFVRKGAPQRPLFLLIIRGQTYTKYGRTKHREPVPYLVNAVPDGAGGWALPLAASTLIFWAWQRWEIEVCHRELKASFGLGDKQCWNPLAAVLSVQWSAWVYALLLLAGYRAWGLCGGPAVPTLWWRGSGRWSFATLWRAYRAALWGHHDFRPLCTPFLTDWPTKQTYLQALRNAVFAAACA